MPLEVNKGIKKPSNVSSHPESANSGNPSSVLIAIILYGPIGVKIITRLITAILDGQIMSIKKDSEALVSNRIILQCIDSLLKEPYNYFKAHNCN